ncbi:propanediol dehydratase small subunit [Halogranum rubrum]|uniref:Propanediol dehydratase small subunit n=2 Tax=Halogranum rubrum TaxID=553466 RepID=A0A1I4CBQ4_9EURY|nr:MULTISPECIES: diol dehydratase small subunit [Halogranum]EJN58774.1 dehydratase small subunit [Halogranum salarium B-1]SFK78375.1 propanediol dehydratase small subunit [Halogranum rubrum]
MTDDIHYPLGDNPDDVKTPNGTKLSDITLEKIVSGDIGGEELVIAPETLEKQAQIAENAGRPQLAQNFRRAAELTAVPDDRILEIYNALRPSGADKQTLHDIADELETEYGAELNAKHVREAVEVYEQRKLF